MPFIPISDDNPLRLIKFQVVTAILIAANVLVFLYELTLDEQQTWEFWVAFGLIPAVLTGEVQLNPALAEIPAWATLVTTMFLHSGYWHLGGNMLFLWVFGDNIEDAMGHVRFVMFFLMCGVFAALVHVFMLPHSSLPLIGASGAVAGIIAAYLILHPKVKVWVLALWCIPIKITAAWALGIWILAQVANLFFDSAETVAWWAHLGGFFAGALLILFMRRRGVILFDRTRGGA